MAATSPKYVIDKKGNKKAILLDIKEYFRLLRRLEKLEDALDLDHAVKEGRKFRDYQDIRAELHRDGRL